jgi:SAM-dependent methyltransferase
MRPGLRESYDRVAGEYARQFRDELDHKPFDRKVLEWLIEKVGDSGVICDMGCGPGQIARYLHDRGAPVCGVDLSPAMVKEAQLANPCSSFHEGDMRDLAGVADGSYGGIAAFYSIVHLPHEDVPRAFRELRRVLRANGVLLLAFHVGKEVVHRDELLGQEVDLDFLFFETEEIKDHLAAAGFALEEVIERDPYPPDVEYPSRRAYVFARKGEDPRSVRRFPVPRLQEGSE